MTRVSQLWDLIETCGFREDIKDIDADADDVNDINNANEDNDVNDANDKEGNVNDANDKEGNLRTGPTGPRTWIKALQALEPASVSRVSKINNSCLCKKFETVALS